MQRWIITYVVLTFAVCGGYALYTGHIWEDYYITFRHSRNLATGHGLVYEPGRRVHGFTSPINTLLPAAFDYAAGSESPMPALWLYRLCSVAALAGAGVIILRLLPASEGKTWLPLVLILLLLTDLKIIAFTSNGQEAGFMCLFLAWSMACVYHGHAIKWLAAGLAWAGLMYTRPDGCVYVAALGVTALVTTVHGRKREFVGLLKAAGVCTAAYLPWVIWATWYYGSFVPHTVLAKRGAFLPMADQPGRFLKAMVFKWLDVIGMTFEPIYMRLGGWPSIVELLCFFVGLAAAGLCFVRAGDRLMRIAAMMFVLLCMYMAYVGMGVALVMPWYLPPVAFAALIALARAPAALPRQNLAGLGLCVVMGIALTLLALGTYQIGIQQREIEDSTRTQIGLWLREHAKPTDVVYLEPLGYIGFFSGCDMADWPGLVSPRVVKLRREMENPDQASIVPLLKPDWLVVRPHEAKAMSRIEAITTTYGLVKEFDATERLKKYDMIPGIGYLMFDSRFLIYRRDPNLKDDATPAGEM